MTVQPSAPVVDPATDPEVTTGVLLFQKALLLLSSLGVAIPAIFQVPAIQVQVVSFLIGLVTLVWETWSHLKTKNQVVAAKGALVAVRASLVASKRI